MIKLTQLDTSILNTSGYLDDVSNLMSSMIMGGIFCDANIEVESKISDFLDIECILTSSGTSSLLMAIEYAITQAAGRPIVFCVSEFLYFSIHSYVNNSGHKIQILKANSDEVSVQPANYVQDHYHIFILTSHHNTTVDGKEVTKNIPLEDRFIIADSCLVFGTDRKYYADVECYSFSNNKMIIAGEGGLFASPSKKIIQWARLRTFSNISPTVDNKLFMYMANYRYTPTAMPAKFSMSALASKLISRQLDVLPVNLEKRKENYRILNENIKINTNKEIPQAPLFYTLVLPKDYSKREMNRIQLKLINCGVLSQVGVLPFSFFEDGKFYKRTLNLPVHSMLKEDNIDTIFTSINKIL